MGVGTGLAFPPSTDSVMGSLPRERSGVGAAAAVVVLAWLPNRPKSPTVQPPVRSRMGTTGNAGVPAAPDGRARMLRR